MSFSEPLVPSFPEFWSHKTFLLRISLVLHLLALPAFCLLPGAWLCWLWLLLLDHALLCAASLLPRCSLLGDNWKCLPEAATVRREIAITIDDGPDPEVTPLVLDVLDRFAVSATFFCIGSRAQEYPALCREIVRRGHAIENHTQHHLHLFSCMGPGRMAAEIEQCSAALQQITGRRPMFFRPPAGLRNPFLDRLLRRNQLLLASWTRRGYDTREHRSEKVLQRLMRGVHPGAILLLHDGNAARGADGQAVILQVLPALLDACQQSDLHPVLLHAAMK
jgi:peptidoglycan/xylan/chitin deacetylase (PgdA/CDA1 family)